VPAGSSLAIKVDIPLMFQFQAGGVNVRKNKMSHPDKTNLTPNE
jgi:hypothetical protein